MKRLVLLIGLLVGVSSFSLVALSGSALAAPGTGAWDTLDIITAGGKTYVYQDQSEAFFQQNYSINPGNVACPAVGKSYIVINESDPLKGTIYTGKEANDPFAPTIPGQPITDVTKCRDAAPITLTNPKNLDLSSAAGTSKKTNDESPSCENSGGKLSWFLCAVYEGSAGFSDWVLRTFIQPMLKTNPVSTDPENTMYQIWSSFRIYGNVFLIIALLVIVFGQSIGGGLVDAYTAKKVLPRLLAAAILINLSIYLVALAVDITNILGGGIRSLITAPLEDGGNYKIVLTRGQDATATVGSLLGLGATGLVGLFSLLWGSGLGALLLWLGLFVVLPVALAVIGAFIMLVLRQALIMALVILSPVAFALYCLPNTEKYFKTWWEWLFKALLIYPIIMVFFSISDVMTVMIVNINR